ncbi:MAG: hypothetical protein EBS90_02600, partial [Betaproteobacteria bacterium]|nr:hypothetical protein [Betaproteobacteria bacterium]
LDGMSLTQKMVGIDIMVTNQPQQSCAIAPPIKLTHGTCLVRGKAEGLLHVAGHAPINLPHHLPTGVMQGVIQINEPQRLSSHGGGPSD